MTQSSHFRLSELVLCDLTTDPQTLFTCRQRREFQIFQDLLRIIPGLEERLLNGDEADAAYIAESVSVALVLSFYTISRTHAVKIQKGVSSARSDDTKSLKGAILDWIVPQGQSLNPPLARNVKMDRGFHHEQTGALLCPTGLDWADPE